MGLEFSRALAARGCDLVLVSNREEELAAAEESLAKEFPVKVRTRFQDLARLEAAEDLYAWCESEGLEVDILVNDAGMFFFKELYPSDLDRIQAMINLHVTTVTRLCVLFGNRMKERHEGYILNVSSMAARIPAPGISVYSSTKAYLRTFGKSYPFELEPYSVKMTTVCPAAIATPLYRLDPKWMKFGVRIGLIKTPQWLVKRALRALFRGRRIISPAFMNVWLPPLISALPGPIEARIWRKVR